MRRRRPGTGDGDDDDRVHRSPPSILGLCPRRWGSSRCRYRVPEATIVPRLPLVDWTGRDWNRLDQAGPDWMWMGLGSSSRTHPIVSTAGSADPLKQQTSLSLGWEPGYYETRRNEPSVAIVIGLSCFQTLFPLPLRRWLVVGGWSTAAWDGVRWWRGGGGAMSRGIGEHNGEGLGGARGQDALLLLLPLAFR